MFRDEAETDMKQALNSLSLSESLSPLMSLAKPNDRQDSSYTQGKGSKEPLSFWLMDH